MELGFSKDFWPRGQGGASSSDALRPLVWDELCAKLNALQHLRRAAVGSASRRRPESASIETLDGNFHGETAQAIAAKSLALDINLKPLANGKADGANIDTYQMSPARAPGDRND